MATDLQKIAEIVITNEIRIAVLEQIVDHLTQGRTISAHDQVRFHEEAMKATLAKYRDLDLKRLAEE